MVKDSSFIARPPAAHLLFWRDAARVEWGSAPSSRARLRVRGPLASAPFRPADLLTRPLGHIPCPPARRAGLPHVAPRVVVPLPAPDREAQAGKSDLPIASQRV